MALSSALISSLTVEKLVRTTGECEMEFLAVFCPHQSADGEPSNSASERLEQFTVVLAMPRRTSTSEVAMRMLQTTSEAETEDATLPFE